MAPRPAVSEFASPPSCSWSLNYALLETGADTVCRSKELAHDALLSQHIDRTGRAVNMLTEEQQYSRHADAAAVLLCGRATPL